MNSYNEPFQPESVEKQIQKLLKKRSYLQDGNSANAHLIHELQDLYDENAAILDHTWERISAELVDADETMKNAPLHQAQTGRFGSAKQTDKRSLPLLLAGLVALLLIASMAMAFRMFPNRETASPSHPLSNGIYLNYTNTHSGEIIKRNPLTGVMAWRYQLPVTARVMDQSIVGNALYVMATNRHVYAINVATGTALWIWSMPEEQPDDTIIPQKIAVSEKLIYVITNKNVYKLNAMSGTLTGSYLIGIIPKQSNPGQAGQVTHCLVESNTLYASAANMLYAYRLSDGTQLWQVQQPTNMIADLSSAQHTLYIASLYYNNAISRIKPFNSVMEISDVKTINIPSGNISISAFDMKSGKQIWTNAPSNDFKSFVNISITVSSYIAYINIILKNGTFIVCAFDTASGKMLWNWDRKSFFDTLMVKRVYIDTDVLFVDPSGQDNRSIVALNAENGTTKWHFPTGGPIQTFMIQDGVIYATTSSTTYALNASNGSVLWKAVNTF